MEMNVHLLTSVVLAIVLYPVFGWVSVFVVVGGFLVDFDHYLLYIIRTGDWSLKKSIIYYRKRKFAVKRPVLHIFHTVEAYIVLLAFALYFRPFLLVLLGFKLHMLLDFVHTAYHKKWGDRTNSVFWFFAKIRKRS
jgi:hypothetical protein